MCLYYLQCIIYNVQQEPYRAQVINVSRIHFHLFAGRIYILKYFDQLFEATLLGVP